MHKWLITGANGNLGRRLIQQLLGSSEDSVSAVVRSNSAEAQIQADVAGLSAQQLARLQISVLNYTDATALAEAARGCDRAVHLVGVIKGDYAEAHERSCEALCRALQHSEVTHISYLSIVGSSAQSANACLRSKGLAEDILRQAPVKSCVLRVPMVLGEGDYASSALAARARGGTSFAFRAASLEQPIYAGDVVHAIRQAAALQLDGSFDLGGPESLTRRGLTERAGAVLGNRVRVVSLPLLAGLLIAGVLEKTTSQPPFTRAMLGVLDHDDNIDSQPALRALQMDTLTPLDDMLAKILHQSGSQ